MATLKDVAAKAGVSASTVSLVLNGRDQGRVKAAVTERVRKVAAELEYTPNRMASGLRTQRSRVLGFISDEIATTPFSGQVVLGAHQAAREHRLQLMMVNSGSEVEREDQGENADLATLLQYQVEGLIYARMYHQRVIVPTIASKVPTVLVDAFSDDPAYASIVPDEERIALDGVGHLIEQGHRRIGFITNEDDIPATHGRLAGYQRALHDAGITYDPALVSSVHVATKDALPAAEQLLRSPIPPTAMFCFNDQIAMGVYQAATRLGIRIPEDLSVVGVDNLDIIASQLDPALTTVALPHYDMGRWAVEHLWQRIQEPETAPTPHIRLHCPLIVRDSVAPPR